MARKIHVCHIITGLETGGAEVMLYRLLSQMNSSIFTAEVISLTNIGPVGKKIQDLGIRVTALSIRRGIPNPLSVLKLADRLRKICPDVVQTWMHHVNLIGGLAAKLAGGIPLAWGIHSSVLDPQRIKRTTIWTVKTCAKLSRWLPTKIVCCSEASRRVHINLGYMADKMVVIPNGFSVKDYKPDKVARSEVRQDLHISEGSIVVGLVGRFDSQKDHRNFIEAAGILRANNPDIYFVMCGDEVSWENQALAEWIKEAGISDHCRLLGRRDDMPRINAAFDIACSASSYGEAFPNVIGEAMACGIPCVVTDVGDAAIMIGNTGRVVPPKDPKALASACLELIEMDFKKRQQLGIDARRRVEQCYSLPAVTARYENLYDEIVRSSLAL